MGVIIRDSSSVAWYQPSFDDSKPMIIGRNSSRYKKLKQIDPELTDEFIENWKKVHEKNKERSLKDKIEDRLYERKVKKELIPGVDIPYYNPEDIVESIVNWDRFNEKETKTIWKKIRSWFIRTFGY